MYRARDAPADKECACQNESAVVEVRGQEGIGGQKWLVVKREGGGEVTGEAYWAGASVTAGVDSA